METRKISLLAGLVACTSLTAISERAFAQTEASPPTVQSSDGNILDMIVVTGARRRDEDVQETPVAVSAFNEATLAANQISNVSDIGKLAPNFNIERQLSTANQIAAYLRGFGNISNDPAIDPPIAIYVDGIYQPIASGSQMDLFGVEAIELERGPQGTLLGKNAPTGALSITSRRPRHEFGGALELGYERFDHKEIKGRIDVPVVSDVLAVNASLLYKEGGNYIRGLQFGGKRKFGGEKVLAGRVGILFTPSSNFEWLVQLTGSNTDNPQTGMRDMGWVGRQGPYQGPAASCVVFGYCAPTKRFTTNAGFGERNESNDRQISSQMTLHLEPVSLTSVTGYKTLKEINKSDVDGTPAPILDALDDPLSYKQFTQEFRISSQKDGGADFGGFLDWVVGGFYSNMHYDNSQLLRIFGTDLSSNQKGRTKSKALFAHVVFNFTDKFNATFGARQSWDRKTHRFMNVGDPRLVIDDPISFKNFSMEGGLQYKFNDDQMVYVRYAEGYRAGGYQGLPAGNVQVPYRPETVKSYEIGFKADFFDRHLRTNLTIFQNDYRDLQRTAILDVPGVGFGQFITNAANARVRGVELEATIVPTDGLTIGITVGYLDPKYKNYFASLFPGQSPIDVSSFPFPYTSKWTARFAPQYVLDMGGGGSLTLGANVNYRSSYYVAEIPYPLARQHKRAIVNASVRWDSADKHYNITVYGQNLTNQHYFAGYTTVPTEQTTPDGAALYSIAQDAKPLTYGVSVGFSF